VPGQLPQKLEALIRSLPKSLRRQLIPAPEVAARVAAELEYGAGSLLSAAAEAFSHIAGETILPENFDLERLPEHLKINIRVIDDRGQVLQTSRDLHALQEKFQVEPIAAAPPTATPWHRDGLTSWDFGDLPVEVPIPARPHPIVKYVAIIDQGEAAGLRLVDSPEEVARLSRGGVRRLLAIAERRELKSQVEWLPKFDQLALYAAPFCRERSFTDQLIDLLADRAWRGLDYRLPESREEFDLLRKDLRREIVPAVAELTKVIRPLCEAYYQIRLALEEQRPAAWAPTIAELRKQLAELTSPGFLTEAPANWLDQYPRFLSGMSERLARLAGGGLARDRQNAAIVAGFETKLRERQEQHRKRGIVDPELSVFRWWLEELRVSLFAQKLGTSVPVSPQRLEKQWAKVRS
jgi:ATP-dependent helicase HrpA